MANTGLVLEGYRSLPEVCVPLADELARCFCVVDAQSGPFDSRWLFESPENEALADRLSWPVPAFVNTSTHGFRPGALPRLAGCLLVDEWSYYFAIETPEAEALRRATALAQHVNDLSVPFLRRLEDVADLLICHVDGW